MEYRFHQNDALKKQLKPFYLFLIVALLLLLPNSYLLFRVNRRILPFFIICNLLMLFCCFLVMLLLWRKPKKPLIIMDDAALTVMPGLSRSLSKRSVRWEEMAGFYLRRVNYSGWFLGKGGIQTLQILTKKIRVPIVIGLQYIENGEEFLARLKERIPDLTEQAKEAFLKLADGLSELRYKDLLVNVEGIYKGAVMVPWERITRLNPNGRVLAGYGGLKVHYRLDKEKERHFVIPAKINEDYRRLVALVVHSSKDAAIDDHVYAMMSASPREAHAQVLTLLLQLLGLTLVFILVPILKAYPAAFLSTNILALSVITWMILWVVSSYDKQKIAQIYAIRRSKLAILSETGLVLGIFLFFLFSPATFQIFLGDAQMAISRPLPARIHYDRALKEWPHHPDLLYKDARANYQLKNYAACYALMVKAYRMEPQNWGSAAIRLLPDSLIKLGRTSEAREWCRIILKDNPNNRDLRRVIGRLLDELGRS